MGTPGGSTLAVDGENAWRFERPAVTVVLQAEGLLGDGPWQKAVVAEESGRSVAFVQRGAAKPEVNLLDDHGHRRPSDAELAAVSAVLQEQGLGGPNPTAKLLLKEVELPPALDGPSKRTTIYSRAEIQQHLDDENAGHLEDLVNQLRSPLGVMPFVGAGMSADFAFPLWAKFLRTTAKRFDKGDEIESLLAIGDYERAAEVLDAHDRAGFRQRIAHTFRGRADPARLRDSPLAYLPLLTTGPVMTTNFDAVLEQAFADAGSPLTPIVGPLADGTVRAVHHNERALLKIHGTHDESTFRVFTTGDYEKSYGEGPQSLASLAWLTFTNRPLLFLGCSLETDRTVVVLTDIHGRLEYLRHYAIVEGRYSVSRLAARATQLSRCGIGPIWYPPGEHAKIKDILRDLVERAGSRPLPGAAGGRPAPRPRTGRRLPATEPAPAPHPLAPAVARAIVDGKVAFFLGAGAHLGRFPLGDEFYADLAERFKCPALSGDRSAIAAFIASHHGSLALWKEVRTMLTRRRVDASEVHRMLALLPSHLRAGGQHAPVWILTTNYDTVMEQQLEEAGEPFHVLYYTKAEGLFTHTDPDGHARIIERPEAIRELTAPATVLVKLNGGLVHGPAEHESVVIASSDFERLAARVPDALPHCLRTTLRERGLLFLGHGLAEPDVKALIDEFASADRPDSWSVARAPTEPSRLPEWRARSVHLRNKGVNRVECDLGAFTASLTAELLAV